MLIIKTSNMHGVSLSGQLRSYHRLTCIRAAIESRSGCLYCRLCSDFVYDPEFESLRLQNSFSTSKLLHPQRPFTMLIIFADGKKRKLNLVSRSMEEEKLVLPNANHLSCQSGAPRGIFNLGQTCYLSVILQTLVHNPMMKNYFLASRHEPTECHLQHCTACAMTTSFVDICTTEKLDGHGPVDLLYKSWMNNPVSGLLHLPVVAYESYSH